MAQRKRKSTRQDARPRAPKDEVPNGVLVTLEPGEKEGDVQVGVAPLGTVKHTEIPALLGIARRMKEEQLGIREGR